MNKLNRRAFLNTIGISATALALPNIISSCNATSKRPNIILIMVDDLGYECLSCNGSTSYSTPYLDQLAVTGVRFTHCYSQPLCTPSRVQIMTGKYNFRNYTEFGALRPGEVTFGHFLQKAGYTTCVAGKWQLAGRVEGSKYRGTGTQPEDAGFDEHCLWQVNKRESRYWDPLIQENGELRTDLEGKYGPDVFCDYINDFVKRNKSNPFFVYFPMALTHNPFVPTPDSNIQPEQRNEQDSKYFGDMVAYTDKIVGQIVGNLDELGIRENTLIMFTADNGTHRNIRSQMGDLVIQGGKGKTTNAGTHVPFIVNWKGVTPEGKVCDDLIDFSDFLPTIMEAADVTIPDDFIVDGRNFLPQLCGKHGNPREWIFCYYHPKWGKWSDIQCFARDKRWKLYQDGRFFDLQADPMEQNPLLLDDLSHDAIGVKERLEKVLDSM